MAETRLLWYNHNISSTSATESSSVSFLLSLGGSDGHRTQFLQADEAMAAVTALWSFVLALLRWRTVAGRESVVESRIYDFMLLEKELIT